MGVADVYASLIRKGIKTKETTPDFIKEKVEELLITSVKKEDATNDNDK